jgi:aldose 1-epimerase
VSRVTYRLTPRDELCVDFEAVADATTLVNLAQHGYYNLGGPDVADVLDHELTLHASSTTPGDPVPTGEVSPVSGTALDFRRAKPIGADIERAGGAPVGYDHNYVVDGEPGTLRPVARVRHPGSGRVMVLESDQPGVQFYSGNFLDGTTSGKGRVHSRHAGFCLESQAFPNAINVPGWREQVILRVGTVYRHRMLLRFLVE